MADMMFRVPPDSLDKAGFMSEFGGIYEHSPWVAEAVLAEGVGADDGAVPHFAARMAAIVDAAGSDRQLALLRAHPELAGKLAVAGGLTAESTAEQADTGTFGKQDRFQFRSFDGDSITEGQQSLRYIGKKAFTGSGLQADTTGDGQADFVVNFARATP